ncbi:MAG: hypothetical protein FJX80_14615 [Bacteroidetes bacterium]|nr:hypothetical protein [Bacteroidota bacterium]
MQSISIRIFLVLFISFGLLSCTKNLTQLNIVYQNDFNKSSIKNIVTFDYYGATKDKFFYFNGSMVLGPFNNAGADFNISDIPEHNILEVSFDLYTHDNWEGNKPTQFGIPDLFVMKYDGNPKFLTSFSSNTQYKQSYPEWFPQGSNPALGNTIQNDLPGRCAWKDRKNGTAMYKIVKQFPHTNKTFQLTLSDALQPFQSECEKSWSIDNLKITALTYY